ncbi:hypothetical protein [Sneathiella aquimaris]|uniref:hypothetical protein n=1 Tax=Sneathiella aquimaris TaxID=2599305 RepID=UPI002260F26A|nr:hypothetical protein [Sneathiella aquimaris]
MYGLPLLEPYALFPLASPVSWLKGFDLVRFELVSDLLFMSGFLFILGCWFFVLRKIPEKTLQRLTIFVVSAGVYIFAVAMAHEFGR